MPTTSAYVAVFAVAVAATLVATPAWRWVAVRLGVVAPVTDRAVHSRPVPYLGGLAMLSGFLAAFGVAWGFGGFGAVFETLTVPLGVALGAVILCGVGKHRALFELLGHGAPGQLQHGNNLGPFGGAQALDPIEIVGTGMEQA